MSGTNAWPTALDPAGHFAPTDGTGSLAANRHMLLHEQLADFAADVESRLGADSTTDEVTVGFQVSNSQPRNYLLNGNFDVAQRGNGPFTANGYTLDRWVLTLGSGSTNSVTRGTHALGVAGKPAKSYLAWNRTVAGSGTSYVYQPIEGVHNLAGRKATVSFYALASASLQMLVTIGQSFGTGGSPSGDVQTAAQVVSLTAAPTRFSLTFDMPSIAGKTLGSNGDDYASIAFGRTVAMTDGTISIWNVQLEDGAVAHAFEDLPVGETLGRCQRYFAKSYAQGQVPGTPTVAGYEMSPWTGSFASNGVMSKVRFPSVMRKTPTVTVYSFTAGTAGKVSDATGTDLAASSGVALASSLSDTGFVVQNQTGGAITAAGGGFIYHWAASAE